MDPAQSGWGQEHSAADHMQLLQQQQQQQQQLQYHQPAAGLLRLPFSELAALITLRGFSLAPPRLIRRVPYLSRGLGGGWGAAALRRVLRFGRRSSFLLTSESWHDVIFFTATKART